VKRVFQKNETWAVSVSGCSRKQKPTPTRGWAA
jgi:hypothetical protein